MIHRIMYIDIYISTEKCATTIRKISDRQQKRWERIERKEKCLLSRTEQQQQAEEIPNGKTQPESRNRLAPQFSVL